MRALAIFGLVLGCATGNSGHLGMLAVKPADAGAPPVTFSVARGHVVGTHLDVRLEDNGCLRGTLGNSPLVLCPDGDRWAGPSGNFTVEPAGNAVRVDGWLTLRGGRDVPITGTIALGQGPQWDELRQHPVLLAVATMAAELGR
jgi:hypothetical protein